MFSQEGDLGKPVSLRFLPQEGKKQAQVITAHKTGVLALWESVYAAEDDYTTLLDIRPIVYSADDHGLLAVELHPDFDQGTTEAFILYTGEPKDVNDLPNNPAVTKFRPNGTKGLYPATTFPIPEWGTYPAGMEGFEWRDYCINLDAQEIGENDNGLYCEHPYYVDRVIIDLTTNPPTAELANTVVRGACGVSSTHGPGNLIRVGKDLVFSQGDGSQWAFLDSGNPDISGCYDPAQDPIQGVYRAQQEGYSNGKVVQIPYEVLSTGQTLDGADLENIAIGLRNPFRMHYHEEEDALYIGDVGLGDMRAGTSERIFKRAGVAGAAAGAAASNFGWPCIEGIRSRAFELDGSLGVYSAWDGDREVDTMLLLANATSPLCEGVAKAVLDLVGPDAVPADVLDIIPADAVADPAWAAPLFEYRGNKPRLLDDKYPELCNADFASVTGVFVYPDGGRKGPQGIPAEYRGKLIFADYVKRCVWYFDDLEAQTPPNVLLANAGIIDMQLGPDGYLYFIDYSDFSQTYIARMMSLAEAPAYMQDYVAPTEEPVDVESLPPFNAPEVPVAETCPDPYAFPEIEWEEVDGEFWGELRLNVGVVNFASGQYLRTRMFDGSIPGKIMRFQACGVYHLTMYNDMEDWPFGREGFDNKVQMPTITNLHVHGMHVSGEFPGDSVATEVWPGEQFTYVYTIPCDHSGGTHWYHPHKHGSTSLQTNGGAAGFIVVDDNKRMGEIDMPAVYSDMPEAFVHFHQLVPLKLTATALSSRDYVFETDLQDEVYLVNGCEALDLTVNAGEWTRVRMLHSGDEKNAVMEIAAPCEIQLLAKDGVYLSQVPRLVVDNKMFFTLSSRVDIALRCPAGTQAPITIQRLGEDPVQYGTVTAVGNAGNAPDLPVWTPCRPAYLMDLFDGLEQGTLINRNTIEVRGGTINGEFYSGYDGILFEAELGAVQEWQVLGDFEHPVHLHVNHVQLGDVSAEQNALRDAPYWNVKGDWLDSWSIPGPKMVRWRPDRFVGHAVFHCHIAVHSDDGMMVMVQINGNGDDALDSPEILEFGSCPVLVASEPYGGKAHTVPGVIEAEYYDLGGENYAFHNIPQAEGFLPMADFRADENGPEIYGMGNVAVTAAAGEAQDNANDYFMSSIFEGEWMAYSVDVEKAGPYTMSLVVNGGDVPGGIEFRLYSGADTCPGRDSAMADKGLLASVADQDFQGAEVADKWVTYNVPFPFDMGAGAQKLLLCFDADTNLSLDSFSLDTYEGTENSSNGSKDGNFGSATARPMGVLATLSVTALVAIVLNAAL
jgi:FtsP/CotA-like multicopper oxidase with cupredoxin domain